MRGFAWGPLTTLVLWGTFAFCSPQMDTAQAATAGASAQPSGAVTPPNMLETPFDKALEQATVAIVQHQYERALHLLDEAAHLQPRSPLPAILRAATVHAEMQDLEQPRLEPLVKALLDSAEAQINQLLVAEDPPVPVLFAAGSLHAYRAYEAVRHHSYFSAYRHGLKANHFFKAALESDSSYCDARIGVGSFQYWRSRALRPISWLPFIPDEREEGLLNLERALPCARLAKWTGLSDLAWILLDAGEPAKAWSVASDGLRSFPNSRFFLWPAAEASYRLGNWRDCERKFKTILAGLRRTEGSSGYNEVICFLKIAEAQAKQGRLREALSTLQDLQGFNLPPETRKRARHLFKQAARLRREIEEEMMNKNAGRDVP